MGGGEGMQETSRTIRHGGEWRTADSWPPPGHEPQAFYLHADGSLSQNPPEQIVPPTQYSFDPADPVPTIGGNLSAIPIPAGGFNQVQDGRFPFTKGTLPLNARHDVLSFISEPLEKDLVVIGPITAKLWVATDGPDTDFTAKLLDIYPPGPHYPDGCALNIADSICRLRFRNGYEQEELAAPGEVYELTFELYPTANRFVAGHQIRVDISSSNYPRFDVNPNTGGPLHQDRCRRVALNSLYHDPARPSQIVLSVEAGVTGGSLRKNGKRKSRRGRSGALPDNARNIGGVGARGFVTQSRGPAVGGTGRQVPRAVAARAGACSIGRGQS